MIEPAERLVRPGSRCSCCSRAAPTRSACSTWLRSSAPMCARSTSTTGFAIPPTRTRRFCRELFPAVIVERVRLGKGNLQALAREARYALAEQHAIGDYATGHTLSDQAETVLMRRLARRPGGAGCSAWRRGAGGWCGRCSRHDARGRRRRTAAATGSSGAQTRRTPTQGSRARGAPRAAAAARADRARGGADDRRDGAAAARRGRGARRAAAGDGRRSAEIAALPPALGRLVLRRLAGAPVRVDELLALAGRGGTVSLDVGHGLRAVVEYGRVRFDSREPAPPLRSRSRSTPPAASASVTGRSRPPRRRPSAPGSPATGSARPAAPSRSRTSSPIARCRARSGRACRSWRRTGRSCASATSSSRPASARGG